MFGQTQLHSKNKPVQREKDRIQKEGKMTHKRAELESIKNAKQKAEFPGVTRTGFSKALICMNLTQQQEAELAHAALTLVRREALRRVLEKEKQVYAKELSQKGLSIYQQRT